MHSSYSFCRGKLPSTAATTLTPLHTAIDRVAESRPLGLLRLTQTSTSLFVNNPFTIDNSTELNRKRIIEEKIKTMHHVLHKQNQGVWLCVWLVLLCCFSTTYPEKNVNKRQLLKALTQVQMFLNSVSLPSDLKTQSRRDEKVIENTSSGFCSVNYDMNVLKKLRPTM